MGDRLNSYQTHLADEPTDVFYVGIGRLFQANVPEAAVATATTVDVAIVTPTTKEAHMRILARANQGVQTFSLIEGPIGVTGGSVITPVQKNRNVAAAVATVTITNGVTGATGGTALPLKRITGAYETDLVGSKVILKAATTYVLRLLTGAAGSNEVDYTLEFFENASRNQDRTENA
jgi:hypothetical protein